MQAAGSAPSAFAYQRHQPEQTLLYQLVEAHYPTLVDLLAQQGKSLPDHVHRKFEAFLKCIGGQGLAEPCPWPYGAVVCGVSPDHAGPAPHG